MLFFKPIINASIYTNFKRPHLFAPHARTFKEDLGRQGQAQRISLTEQFYSCDFEGNWSRSVITIVVIAPLRLSSATVTSVFLSVGDLSAQIHG